MYEEDYHPHSLPALAPQFLRYAQVELHFAPETILKYRDCLRQVERSYGNSPLTGFGKADVMALKARFLDRNLSVNRQVTILLALKRFLRYTHEEHGLGVIDPNSILIPRRPRKEVAYLTADEVERFIASIKTQTGEGHIYLPGLRFRTLVEVLLGSAMRISEALSLNRADIDFTTAEAKITGKGSKERTVFFTDRALAWIKRYIECRTDDHPALFVTADGLRRLKRPDIWRPFNRYRKASGIAKKISAHLLRHTAATQLLFNGCPVGHIKEILGHERLETTCRYYLGLDHRAAKAAHRKFLVYDSIDQPHAALSLLPNT
jgi:integrase/recombinase XerD